MKMKMELEGSKTQSSSILSNRSTGKSQSENIKYDLRQKTKKQSSNLCLYPLRKKPNSFLTRKDEKVERWNNTLWSSGSGGHNLNLNTNRKTQKMLRRNWQREQEKKIIRTSNKLPNRKRLK